MGGEEQKAMTKKSMSPIEFARMRRRVSDEYERLLWQHLRNRQRCKQKFRREHPIGVYIADFYCAAAKLVVEIDGESHLSEEAKRYDSARDRWMKSEGIEVLRFSCFQVENELPKVLAKIDCMINRILSTG